MRPGAHFTPAVGAEAGGSFLIVGRGDRDDGIVVLSPTGRLDLIGASRLHRAVSKAIIDLPRAVVVVLHDVVVTRPVVLSVFTAAAREAEEWQVRLGVASSDDMVVGTLRALRLHERVAIGATADDVARGLAAAPATVQSQLTVHAGTAAPAACRAWLRESGEAWGISATLAEDALVVLGELVTNVVVHVGSGDVVVRLSYRGGRLRIAVRDSGAMVGLRAQDPQPNASYGRGLMLVDALSRRWGVASLGLGKGKVVWAVLLS